MLRAAMQPHNSAAHLLMVADACKKSGMPVRELYEEAREQAARSGQRVPTLQELAN